MTVHWGLARTVVISSMAALGLALAGDDAAAIAPPAAATPVGLTNPSFENGLSGWTATGQAFAAQPTYGENVIAARVGPVTIGGDYWKNLPFPVGVQGDFWIGTYEKRSKRSAPAGRTQGDALRGSLTSHRFTLPSDAKYISFLIGGGDDPKRLKLELLEVKKTGQTKPSGKGGMLLPPELYVPVKKAPAKTGLNSEVLRRDWWDIRGLDRGREYVIRITDDSSSGWGHINVDDIRFETAAPTSQRIDGHAALLRTSIRGKPVWTDYDAPLWGAADLHTHPMSHLSMGRKLMHGAPDVGSLIPKGTQKIGNGCNTKDLRAKSVAQALGDCSATHGGWGVDNTCGDHIRAFAINVAFDSDFEHRYPYIPTDASCPSGMENDAGLCYAKCPAGFKGVGSMCQKICPAGFRDDGLYCAKPEAYGRGDGYPLNAGEFNLDGAMNRCRADHARGCEQHGLVIYPKCREGFYASGCCICTPKCPAGMNDIGVSCEKGGTFTRRGGSPPTANLHGDHPHAGYPKLVHWPHWSTKAHQQMYVDWIRRAHEGGLNLMVALAVNNELLAEVVNGDVPKDDKRSGDLQIDEIKSFVRRHPDFMREVRTPAEYRQAVKDGKLAVIIGVELDNIGNFNVGNPGLTANAGAVKREIRRLHAKGVRYIFPLHFADNIFGGVAVKGELFNLSNRFARTRPLPLGAPYPPGRLYQVESAKDPDINYRVALLGPDGEWAHGLTFAAAKVVLDALGTLPFPPAFHAIKCPVPTLGCVPQFKLLSSLLTHDPEWDMYTFVKGGHVNKRGLTPTGELAIKEMMRLGMIIDVDHMSDKAVARTLEIAEANDYPLMSGHTGFRDSPRAKEVNENMRSADQLSRLGALGGMMGVGWAGGDARGFLHNYRYGLAHTTRNPNTRAPAFSLGSDINGFEEMPRKRAGSKVSYDPKQRGGLRQYSFGGKTWDYNRDGVAHIGLYPDIWQDLRNLNMRLNERTEFFSAADAFAKVWDKADARRSSIR